MASAFKLPDLGEGLTEGEVARWLVAEGQEIAEDDPLVEIQTDKATVEIPSPVRRDGAEDPRGRGRGRCRSEPSSSSSAQPARASTLSSRHPRLTERLE